MRDDENDMRDERWWKLNEMRDDKNEMRCWKWDEG